MGVFREQQRACHVHKASIRHREGCGLTGSARWCAGRAFGETFQQGAGAAVHLGVKRWQAQQGGKPPPVNGQAHRGGGRGVEAVVLH
jgi:hypothetical protein